MDAFAWVLVALEGVDVVRFSTFGAMQSHLVQVVGDAARRYAEFWHTQVHEDTRSALDALSRCIAESVPDTVRDVQPLPYRRPLADPEVRSIWRQISARWGLPATPPPSFDELVWHRSRSDVLVSNVDTFDRAVPPRVLRSILEGMGAGRIWKLDLPVESWSFKMDLAFVDTRCDWGECYWTPQDLDWILYVSHEADLVVGGGPLLAAIDSKGSDPGL